MQLWLAWRCLSLFISLLLDHISLLKSGPLCASAKLHLYGDLLRLLADGSVWLLGVRKSDPAGGTHANATIARSEGRHLGIDSCVIIVLCFRSSPDHIKHHGVAPGQDFASDHVADRCQSVHQVRPHRIPAEQIDGGHAPAHQPRPCLHDGSLADNPDGDCGADCGE